MQRFPYTDSGGVQILSKVSPQFEELYLRALRKENRIYSDAEVKELPKAFFYNLHRQEWADREKNANRLLAYLRKVQGDSQLLDIGCGNGWLANRIARMEQFKVWGIDINLFALQQAKRVFNAANLHFAYGDIFEDIFPTARFDCIILNQTIDFFPDLAQLINRCRYFLKSGGEIHIIDSPLYQDKELESARQKSIQHFENLGVPEMSDFYFHHTRNELDTFDFQFLYKPRRLFGKNDSPYPWVRIIN
jgi:SAM-dependent methyltransferase